MTIIIYGDKKDQVLFNMIENYLQDKIVLSSISSAKIDFKRNSKITIIDTDDIENLKIESGIIVLKNKCNLKLIEHINPNVFVVVNSNNKSQIRKLAKKHFKVITAGLYEKDTVTFSSNTDDCCTVSLQRSINSQNSIIEPLELPVQKSKKSYENQNYILLAYATLLILIDNL